MGVGGKEPLNEWWSELVGGPGWVPIERKPDSLLGMLVRLDDEKLLLWNWSRRRLMSCAEGLAPPSPSKHSVIISAIGV